MPIMAFFPLGHGHFILQKHSQFRLEMSYNLKFLALSKSEKSFEIFMQSLSCEHVKNTNKTPEEMQVTGDGNMVQELGM